ncbi:MAG: aldo/keto reductase [Polyangiaceae bacterium]|jgi:aryl-alcohol dehydrogenase-like predicted oxidoreductase
MAAFPNRVTLGRTGLRVAPLAVSGGYGVDDKSLLRAFDRGVNYWYHGSLQRSGMTSAVRQLVAGGKRDELVLVLQSYARWPWLLERGLVKSLRLLGVDHCDVLLLGWYNSSPSASILDRVERLRGRGLLRHVAISSHSRPAFQTFAKDPRYGILHVRYNAAHTGAERDVFPMLPATDRPGIVVYTATRWGTLLKATSASNGEAPMRARDAYRFVLSNPDVNVCMTGPRNGLEMQEALAALDEGPLLPEEDERVRRLGQAVYKRAWRMG